MNEPTNMEQAIETLRERLAHLLQLGTRELPHELREQYVESVFELNALISIFEYRLRGGRIQ